MDVGKTTKILILLVSLLTLYAGTCQSISSSSICRAQRTCQACISSHPECSWCSEHENPGVNETVKHHFRCSVASESKCNASHIQNPRSGFDPIGNDDYTNVSNPDTGAPPIQLKPQKLNVKLRKDEPVVVNITFEKTVEYPLDLYYVMDLSHSMKDDLEKLQSLGGNLIESIRTNVTKNVKLGFGSFVDKVMMPYASTVEDHLKNPCAESDCGPVFGFQHQLKITENGDEFKNAVAGTRISGNIDSPEGGFDALMQIAVCQELIGWRKDALRVILYASDASPHIALDGKLAAILEANDGKCHLTEGANTYLPGAVVYSKSKELDYPSVGQLRDAFKNHKITTIFAVTKDVFKLYKDLEGVLGSSFAGELEEDSSNVVDVISVSYNKLKSLITLAPPTLPENIEMEYRVLCPGSTAWEENKLQCENAGEIGDTVTFQFSFKATKCPKDPKRKDKVKITSGQLSDETDITFEYSCSCDCESSMISNSTVCNFKGDYECGTCKCNPGHTGRNCQCEGKVSQEDLCRQKTVSSQFQSLKSKVPVCSGNGFCECGECECYDGHFGEHCQCLETGCPDTEDGVCGGEDKGKCHNCNGDKQCKCNKEAGYSLSKKNKACTCNEKYCKKDENPDNAACNGNGHCDCDHCICETFQNKPVYQGAYCEECIHPQCKNKQATCEDLEFAECAKCVYNSIRVSKSPDDECVSECKNKTISFERKAELPNCENSCQNSTYTKECKLCEKIDKEWSSPVCKQPITEVACDATYKIVWDKDQTDYYLYVREFNKETDCAKPIDPLLIVFPVVGAILLIGFILLVVWKAYTHFRDKLEYRTFLEDQKKSRWTQGENPLFSKASVRVENPAFIGK